MPPSQKGALLVVLAGACYGAIPVFARMARADGVDSASMVFLRFALSAVALMLWMHWQKLALPRGRTLLALIAMGAIGYSGMSLCFFAALKTVPAGTVSLLLYLYPALVLLLSALLFGEHLSRTRMAALLLSSLGMAITVGGALSGALSGVLLGVGSALFYAAYVITGGRYAWRVHPLAATTVVMASGAASNALLQLLGQDLQLPASASGWLGVVLLAGVSTVAATALFLAGMARVGASRASLLSTSEPLFTLLLAATFLGEMLSATQVLGGALIISGVLLAAAEKAKKLQAATG
ncbi:DMT family transporter [Rhodobacteraceae bacterium CH30]|nr:DMT family transporter [Rhodobacteraceae bacterium CH30]